LSAEQELLAQRGDEESRLASRSSDLRVRLASGDPDPELASNQELASIIIDGRRSEPPQGTTGVPVEGEDTALAEVLQSLQITLPAAGQ